ncbi:hypothetical protein ZWY2020_043909 [Hordeum vulgare]|nr:hypothetical protein ZWY2020_043909 [Hordeum vulgare]
MGSRALAVLCLLAVSVSALLAPAHAVPAGGDDDGCEAESAGRDKAQALRLKIIAIFCILAGSAVGAGLPSLGRRFPALRPETDLFLAVKAFAGGVILATALVHILPAAFEALRSPCLVGGPWKRFPFAGLVAMLAAIATLIVDTVATGYFHRTNAKRAAAVTDEPAPDDRPARGDLESASDGHHGHAHGHGISVLAGPPDGDELVRHRVISQVLELGVVVHSLIIGMSLGASDFPSTVRPLVPALTFHQLFEGVGLGGCIVQAKFRLRSVVAMGLLFSMTTPVGIGVGIAISSVYDESSPTALVVQGLLEAAAAGILVYMALVDILAEDFSKPRVQSRARLQLALNVSLLLGAGLMSLLAIWA